MEPGKPITNPMLVGTIELMKAEDTKEHREMFINEMVKARYLAPVVITPPPTPDGEGKMVMAPGAKIQFPMLTAPDGKQFLMAFTDGQELKKWQKEAAQPTFVLTFDDYAGMLLTRDKDGNTNPAFGFVINPYGGNIMITKDMVAIMLANKLKKSGIMPKRKPAEAETTEATGADESANAADAE